MGGDVASPHPRLASENPAIPTRKQRSPPVEVAQPAAGDQENAIAAGIARDHKLQFRRRAPRLSWIDERATLTMKKSNGGRNPPASSMTSATQRRALACPFAHVLPKLTGDAGSFCYTVLADPAGSSINPCRHPEHKLDPQGYYARLGLEPVATQAAIARPIARKLGCCIPMCAGPAMPPLSSRSSRPTTSCPTGRNGEQPTTARRAKPSGSDPPEVFVTPQPACRRHSAADPTRCRFSDLPLMALARVRRVPDACAWLRS